MTLLNYQIASLNEVPMEPTRSTVEHRCHELVAKGNALFGTNVILASIRWDLRGAGAGQAKLHARVYSVRFNIEAKRLDPNNFFNEIVPHEIAHLIVFALIQEGRSKDRGHGRDFKRVCRALGGTGERCHTLELPKARVHTKYKYTTESGRTAIFGGTVHKKIQEGRNRRFNDTGERIAYNHYVGMV